MTNIKLKPCPFPTCGSDDTGIYAAHSLEGLGGIEWAGKCKKCNSQGPTRTTTKEASKAWNARDIPDDLLARQLSKLSMDQLYVVWESIHEGKPNDIVDINDFAPRLLRAALDKEFKCRQRTWVRSLDIGDTVCDCRYKHLKIIEIGGKDSDNVYDISFVLEDGSNCSAIHCCNPVDHTWAHPEESNTEL